jgi:hypothetical protein
LRRRCGSADGIPKASSWESKGAAEEHGGALFDGERLSRGIKVQRKTAGAEDDFAAEHAGHVDHGDALCCALPSPSAEDDPASQRKWSSRPKNHRGVFTIAALQPCAGERREVAGLGARRSASSEDLVCARRRASSHQGAPRRDSPPREVANLAYFGAPDARPPMRALLTRTAPFGPWERGRMRPRVGRDPGEILRCGERS